ncbi:hypothetical protein BDP27DRAFT_1424284 [Rhodocollybia butyracea]|uniref:HMG box domain-containing protein n=1 Tax=Rhodocollybia butyracea TaxID=206335 RepID=A0A9P5PP42_9AGAR|nr:hypothetical protein BDP27DRAFT_1424284 [Rhodocollybia butyracea]
MPAERSRGSRRSGADGNQLVWTMPVEPASPSGISFATNLTPITFNDSDSPGETPESDLFPSANDPSSPRRPAHSKKKAENHIPRPPNAFILFRSSFIKSQHVSTEVETNHSTLSKIIGLTWQNLPEDERQVWHAKAKAALDDHKRKFPQYAFRPLHCKAKGGTEKRKVREVGPKDMKRCAKIAELLVEGKKGQELDAAIQEFDKHHIPEVVTRFEAPITERTFRRSSPSAIKEEDNEEVPSPSRTRSPYERRSRSSSVDRSLTYIQSRSASPGGLPSLVDPEDVPQYLAARSSSLHMPSPPPSSQNMPESSYSYSSGNESPFDLNTFSFESLSASTNSSLHDSSLSDESAARDFGMFNTTSAATERRPSLSIDTSYSDISALVSMPGDWTRSSSPMSAQNISVPSTPCYPVSPMPGQYNPGMVPYRSTPGLRHTSSSLSLQSTASFESTSSYDDFSSSYLNEYDYQSPSTPCDFPQYDTSEISMFIPGDDMSSFVESSYGSASMSSTSFDDIYAAKAQAQARYQYSQAVESFNIDFSPFLSPPLPLGQC